MKTNYLSEIRESLPLNVMYNKVRVGCGGTTLALTSKQPYVICVPYVSLVDNKMAQMPEDQMWLPVKAGVSKYDIIGYISEATAKGFTPKIIVTYDSLPKVTEMIEPQDFYLLVDEYHILFQQYSFRYNAVQGVLRNYKKYKAFTFMTATPIEIDVLRNFTLTELEDVPYYEQEWNDDNEIEVKVEACQCSSVAAKVVDLINKHLNGTLEGNAYFFCNSLKFIDAIYESIPELDNHNTRVIYSKNNNAEYNFKRGFTTDEPKKINFLTSTAFEGCDIYDENGVTYIISDAYKKHTLLDISSSVQQIIGRIRNSKYKGLVVHVYSRDRYIDVDADIFDAKQEEYKAESAAFAERLNANNTKKDLTRLSIAVRPNDNGEEIDTPYTIIRDGVAIFDENLVKLDAYQYRIRQQYCCKAMIEVAYKNIYADVTTTKWYQTLKDLGVLSGQTFTFVEAVKECREASKLGKINENVMIRKHESKFPILNDAIKKLGYEKIATMQYSQKRIKDALLRESNKGSIAMKVVTKLNIDNGTWISSADLKKKMQKAYDVLDIKEKAKASDAGKYYSCEERAKKINGKVVKGYIIYLPKFKKVN